MRVACETGAATVGEDHRTAAASVDWSSTAATVSIVSRVASFHIVGHDIFTEVKIKMVLYYCVARVWFGFAQNLSQCHFSHEIRHCDCSWSHENPATNCLTYVTVIFIYLLLAIKIHSWPLLICATTHELYYHIASASRKKNYSLSFTHKSDLLFWHQKRIYDMRLFWAWWKMDYAVFFCVCFKLVFLVCNERPPCDLCCMASDIRKRRFNIDPFLLTLRSTRLKMAQCQAHL